MLTILIIDDTVSSMPDEKPWYETIGLPVLLRHARTTYGSAMRKALDEAGYDDIPPNGLYVIGGLALDLPEMPLSQLIKELRISKQAAGQLVDMLVSRGYLERSADKEDRRKLTVTLTERGRAATKVQTTAREKVDNELLTSVGLDDINRTRRTLAVLIDIGHQPGQAGNEDE
jgi:DNA-binding MarR family transcriptional regulator